MKLNISMSVDVSPEEIKQFLKLAKKFGATELLQTALSAATPTPADEPELPVGTFVGGEEVPNEEPSPDHAPTPNPKRNRKPKATLGFR